jgi:hypothetical protein
MPETVDHKAAKEALDRAWSEINSELRPPARMRNFIESVLAVPGIAFKYILVTAFLSKYVNANVHARALQTASSLKGAYDARSVCHGVVVGFEKSKGNLFGLSNEPFLSKPARHREHDGENPQLKNKQLAEALHGALDEAQAASRKNIYLGLVHILRIASQHAADEREAKVIARANLGTVMAFIDAFLEETDGGSRLVGVWGAFITLLSENSKVKVYPPSSSDAFADTAGDVELYFDGVLISASECKQRALNLDDVKHGISKALKKSVPEYFFVISDGLAAGQEELIMETLQKHSAQIDLSLVDIWRNARRYADVLNPIRRAQFGTVVVKLLREMRKFDSANAAAEIWNKITG